MRKRYYSKILKLLHVLEVRYYVNKLLAKRMLVLFSIFNLLFLFFSEPVWILLLCFSLLFSQASKQALHSVGKTKQKYIRLLTSSLRFLLDMIFCSWETSLNYWVIMTRLIFFLAGSMAPRICQSIPWLSCVARAGSGEKHFQTVQSKELFITIDAAAKRIEIWTAGAKDNIHVHLNCKYHLCPFSSLCPPDTRGNWRPTLRSD